MILVWPTVVFQCMVVCYLSVPLTVSLPCIVCYYLTLLSYRVAWYHILCVVVLLCVVLAQALRDPLWALSQTSNALELCHWGFRWTSCQISRAKVHTTSQVSVHL